DPRAAGAGAQVADVESRQAAACTGETDVPPLSVITACTRTPNMAKWATARLRKPAAVAARSSSSTSTAVTRVRFGTGAGRRADCRARRERRLLRAGGPGGHLDAGARARPFRRARGRRQRHAHA